MKKITKQQKKGGVYFKKISFSVQTKKAQINLRLLNNNIVILVRPESMLREYNPFEMDTGIRQHDDKFITIYK